MNTTRLREIVGWIAKGDPDQSVRVNLFEMARTASDSGLTVDLYNFTSEMTQQAIKANCRETGEPIGDCDEIHGLISECLELGRQYAAEPRRLNCAEILLEERIKSQLEQRIDELCTC